MQLCVLFKGGVLGTEKIPSANLHKGHQVPHDKMHFRMSSCFLHDATNSIWHLASWVKELGRICLENMNYYPCEEKMELRKINREKQPLDLLVLRHMVQLFPCSTPPLGPPLVAAPWGRIWPSSPSVCRCLICSSHWLLVPAVTVVPLLSLGAREGDT